MSGPEYSQNTPPGHVNHPPSPPAVAEWVSSDTWAHKDLAHCFQNEAQQAAPLPAAPNLNAQKPSLFGIEVGTELRGSESLLTTSLLPTDTMVDGASGSSELNLGDEAVGLLLRGTMHHHPHSETTPQGNSTPCQDQKRHELWQKSLYRTAVKRNSPEMCLPLTGKHARYAYRTIFGSDEHPHSSSGGRPASAPPEGNSIPANGSTNFGTNVGREVFEEAELQEIEAITRNIRPDTDEDGDLRPRPQPPRPRSRAEFYERGASMKRQAAEFFFQQYQNEEAGAELLDTLAAQERQWDLTAAQTMQYLEHPAIFSNCTLGAGAGANAGAGASAGVNAGTVDARHKPSPVRPPGKKVGTNYGGKGKGKGKKGKGKGKGKAKEKGSPNPKAGCTKPNSKVATIRTAHNFAQPKPVPPSPLASQPQPAQAFIAEAIILKVPTAWDNEKLVQCPSPYRLRKDLPYQLTAAAFTADGKVRSDFIWWEILNEKGRSTLDMYALFIDVGFNADKHNVPIPKKRDEFGKQGEDQRERWGSTAVRLAPDVTAVGPVHTVLSTIGRSVYSFVHLTRRCQGTDKKLGGQCKNWEASDTYECGHASSLCRNHATGKHAAHFCEMPVEECAARARCDARMSKNGQKNVLCGMRTSSVQLPHCEASKGMCRKHFASQHAADCGC